MKRTEQLRARWAALAPREQRLLGGAAALVALALVWWLALAPALRTLRTAPAEHARLDAQMQKMTTLQARAKALQSQPRANPADAMRALESGMRERLGGNAQLQSQGGGDGVRVTLKGVEADALAQWLAQARSNARALTREAHLTRASARPDTPPARSANGRPPSPAQPAPAPPDPASDAPHWDGSVVLGLPAER